LKEVENEDLSFLTSLFSPHFRGNCSKGPSISMLITGMDCSRMNFSSNSILNEWIGHLLSTSPRDMKWLMISRSRCSLQFALLLLKTNLLAAETGPQLANLYFPVSIMFICCCFSIYKNLPFFRFISLVLPAWDTVLYTINKRKHFIIIKTS